MKKIIKWVKQNNEDMGIVYMLWALPAYLIFCVVGPVLISVLIGYGVYKLVLNIIS